MSKISNCFKALQASHKKALIPFITAGDTSTEITLPLMHAMVESGANILELGVPFSDPMADGPIIQKASERALANGMNLEKVFQMVSDFRQKDSQTPIVLMGYLNPIEKMGYKTFAKKAADCGVDGVLTVDLPPEESAGFCQELSNNQLDPIFLIAPTSKPERIKTICEVASGFVYYVLDESLDGKQTSLDEAIEGRSINNTAVVHFVDMFSKYGTVEKNMPQDFGNNVGDVVFLKGNKFRHIGFIIRENRDLRIIHNTSNSGGYSNEIWNESAWKRRGWDVEYGSLSLDDKVKINN